jgi:uncharacterized protein YndB with AHSA1/START domain
MKPQIEMSTVVSATPDEVYAAWLDAASHAAMTGGAEAKATAAIGAPFTAWDGYIRGVILELEPGRRIVQAWRTTEFPGHAPDSRLEVLLLPEGGETRVLLRHAVLPEDQVDAYRSGWHSYYFEPMQKYFGGRKAKPKRAAAARTVDERASRAEPGGTRSRPSSKGGATKKTATKAKAEPGAKSRARRPAKGRATNASAAKGRAATGSAATSKAGAKSSKSAKKAGSAARRPSASRAATSKRRARG